MKDLNCYEMYLKSMKTLNYLTAEEEQELVEKAKKGDKRAKDRILNSALHYVIKVAGTFRANKSLSFDDLIGYGNLGLVKAFDKYSLDKGTRFITYASFWIRKEISDALKTYTRTIRLPQNCEEDLSKIISVMDELPFEMTENERCEKVSSALGMKEDYVKKLLAASGIVKSLDDSADDSDTESASFLDKIADTRYQSPEEAAETEEVYSFLDEVLESLPASERLVLVKRTGYDHKGCRSLSAIGDEMGMSKENVRTIERHALVHCREYENMGEFSDYFAA